MGLVWEIESDALRLLASKVATVATVATVPTKNFV